MSPIKLRTSDVKIVEVDEGFLRWSSTLKIIVDSISGDEDDKELEIIPIPLSFVIFQKILDWTVHHQGDSPLDYKEDDDHLRIVGWDAEFTRGMDPHSMFELITGAMYLDMREIVKVVSHAIAEYTGNKTPKQVRQMIASRNNFYKIVDI